MPSGVIAGVTSMGDLHTSTHRTNAHRSDLVLSEVEPAWHRMAWRTVSQSSAASKRRHITHCNVETHHTDEWSSSPPYGETDVKTLLWIWL